MNTKDFLRLGVPLREATRRATDFVAQYVLRGGDTAKLEDEIKAIVASPALFAGDPLRKEFAKAIANSAAKVCLQPDNPHPACGHLLPLPQAKDNAPSR